jgi:hypothetical protein
MIKKTVGIFIVAIALIISGTSYSVSNAATDRTTTTRDALAQNIWPTVVYNWSSYDMVGCDNNASNQPVNCVLIPAGQSKLSDTDWLIPTRDFDLYQNGFGEGSFPAYTGLRYSDANTIYIYNAGTNRVSVHGWGPGKL